VNPEKKEEPDAQTRDRIQTEKKEWKLKKR
jgi:hypothetical protein